MRAFHAATTASNTCAAFTQQQQYSFTDTASLASDTSLPLSGHKSPAMVQSARGAEESTGGKGDGGALTPTSTTSNLSGPTITTNTAMHMAAMHTGNESPKVLLLSTDRSHNSEEQAAMAAPAPSRQPQRRVRQWTPRRQSPGASSRHSNSNSSSVVGEGVVTTVRDWVLSARCSPSKEPRSTSLSRRDRFVSSFASALVPRGTAAEEASEVYWSRTTTVTTTRRDSVLQNAQGRQQGEDETISEGQQQQCHRLQSPQRTVSWRQLRSHPGGASSRMLPPPPLSSSLTGQLPSASSVHSSLSSTPTFSPAPSRDISWVNKCEEEDEEKTTGNGSNAEYRGENGNGCLPITATLERGWGGSGRHSQEDAGAFSGVSSPSVMTPMSSRSASPAFLALYTHAQSRSEHKRQTLQPRTGAAPPPPLMMAARELEQMREWQSTTAALQQQQQHMYNNENVPSDATSFLPPTVPRAGQRWGGSGEPCSVRSDSLSRASGISSYSNAPWSWGVGEARGSNATTSLGWRTDSTMDNNSTEGTCNRQLFSAVDSPCPSPISSSHGFSNCNGGGIKSGRLRDGSYATIPLSPTSPGFPHPLSLSDLLSSGRGGRLVYGNENVAVDARTMEDIEDENAKRKCVESPTASPALTSLSFSLGASSLSLAEALASSSSRMAVPSEVHLWEQRQRRRRGVSPSLARPNDDKEDADEKEGDKENEKDKRVVQKESESSNSANSINSISLGRQYPIEASAFTTGMVKTGQSERNDAAFVGAGLGGNDSSSRCDSLVTSAASAPFLTGLDYTQCNQSSHSVNKRSVQYVQSSSPSLAPLREATVAPSAAVCTSLRRSDGNGVVVEVGAEHKAEDGIEEGSDLIAGRAASLSFCSASEDEPEVDTFALERAQAVMEDADAEAISMLLSTQHHRYVHATSDFAQDLLAHGGHVDPALLWESEAEAPEANLHTPILSRSGNNNNNNSATEEEGSSTELSYTAKSLDMGTANSASTTALCSPTSPPPVPPPKLTTAIGSASNSAAVLSPFAASTNKRCTSSIATTATGGPSTPLAGHINGDDRLLCTPPRLKRPTHQQQQHVRWGEPEGNEEARTPGSTTTVASSRSLRDVSPPVRERSMAPAELRKEREEV